MQVSEGPTGTINMSEVHEVRPSKDPSAPDLALDIWTTSGRVFVVVPLNEESKGKWMAALQNAVDEFGEGDVSKVGSLSSFGWTLLCHSHGGDLARSAQLARVAALRWGGGGGQSKAKRVSVLPGGDQRATEAEAPSKSRAAIKASIKKDGILNKKTDNRVTGAVTMKKRYFALTSSQVTAPFLSGAVLELIRHQNARVSWPLLTPLSTFVCDRSVLFSTC